MTRFYDQPTADEIEYVAVPGEPSHVHIPRPSRRIGGLVAAETDEAPGDRLTPGFCFED
jgi:hypothetical protein